MPTINQAIAASSDDGQAGTGAGYSTTVPNIVLGGYFGTANGWFRFPSTGIPEGATISTATLTFDKSASAAGLADLIYYGNKVTSPTNPSSDSDYNAKTLTSASVTHNSQSGTTGSYTSPELATIIQELVNQSGFSGTIMLLIKDNNSNANHGGFENRIRAKAYDTGSGTFPTLNVTYTDPVPGGQPTSKRMGGIANAHGGYRYGSGQRRWRHEQDNWQQRNGLWLPNNKLIKPDTKLAV